jgi:ABC-type dipeptide/oligopeptide/nickel transport system ATPase component
LSASRVAASRHVAIGDGLVPQPPGRIAGGEIRFEDKDLLSLSAEQMRELRGDRISMIFQEPMTSLNPAFTIGDQISEAILRHRSMTRDAAKARAIEMLQRVRIPSPERRYDDYPHRLSGGMRQRVMIAMALACGPKLLIAMSRPRARCHHPGADSRFDAHAARGNGHRDRADHP